jgi:putative ABC transport system permease protein
MIFLKLTLESLLFAWGSLKSNPFRTILSLAGVTIGIFVIIAVFTFVDSLENSIKNSFSFLGTNNINVEKWELSLDTNYPWWRYRNRPNPTYHEYARLAENLTSHKAITILATRGNVTLKRGNNNISGINVRGVTFDHHEIYSTPIEFGRYFTSREVSSGANVIIIGSTVAENLFLYTNPLNNEIKILGRVFTVIGVMAREGRNFLGTPSNDESCLIPINSFSRIYYMGKRRGVNPTITVKGHDEDIGLVKLEGELRGLMRKIRGLKPAQEDDFSLNRPEAISNAVSAVFNSLTIAGGLIGGLAILVGTFGIANIMFVSVQERVPIIGIQKAVGAKTYFIMFEFLFESIFLSTVGGCIGMVMVYLLTYIPMGTLEVVLSLKNVAVGLGISSLAGLLAGAIPAYQASMLNPVTAIRN